MPVVSQSIMKPMVPVGASTEACALRQPCAAPIWMPSCQTCEASFRMLESSDECVRWASVAAACLRMTRVCASLFRA